jgi:uncharacterized protein (TIGR02118 family)
VIKTVHGMYKRPGMSIEDLHHNWFEKHGPIVATAPRMVRYVQQITLPDSYDKKPGSTLDGASMTWFETLEDFWYSVDSGGWQVQTVDAPNWFDLTKGRIFSIAHEYVVLDGVANTTMTKLIAIVARAPGLPLEEFQRRWLNENGPLAAKLPGLRRYVQNHSLPGAYGHAGRELTHDGWSEFWFDNADDLYAAMASPEAAAVTEASKGLFDRGKLHIVVARERVVVAEPRY